MSLKNLLYFFIIISLIYTVTQTQQATEITAYPLREQPTSFDYTIEKNGSLIEICNSTNHLIDSDTSLKTILETYAQNDKRIRLNQSQYEITTSIYFEDLENFQLWGYGNTSFISTTAFGIRIINSTNIVIANIGIKGDSLGTWESAITVYGTNQNITIQQNILTDFIYDGIQVLEDTSNLYILQNYLSNMQDDGINIGGYSEAQKVTNSIVSNNQLYNIDSDAIHFSDSSQGTHAYLNTITTCGNGLGFYKSQHNRAYNNTINGVNYGIIEHTSDCDYNKIFRNQFTNYNIESSLQGIQSEEFNNIWDD